MKNSSTRHCIVQQFSNSAIQQFSNSAKFNEDLITNRELRVETVVFDGSLQAGLKARMKSKSNGHQESSSEKDDELTNRPSKRATQWQLTVTLRASVDRYGAKSVVEVHGIISRIEVDSS